MNKKVKMNVSLCALAVSLGLSSTAFASCNQKESSATPIVVPSGLVDLTYAAEKSVNSVVYIQVKINSKTQTVEYEDPFADFFDFFGGGGNSRRRGQVQTPERRGAGSGVIVSDDGYIVTNNHVVEDADEITVKLSDDKECKARIIGLDKETDLALIKIEEKNLPAIAIGNSDDLKLGEWVLAVGNPFNLTSTVTAGIVSAKARSVYANGIESFIQTDAAINAGNSGGALVNARGELVGINSMIYSQTGSYAGYGFAIPTTIVTKVFDDIKKFGCVQRAVLGIKGTEVRNYVDKQESEGKSVDLGVTQGIYVDEVDEGTTAAEAGLKKGDVILSLNGKDIKKFAEVHEAIAKFRPGDKISLTYLRDKKKLSGQATLRNKQGNTAVVKEVDSSELGISLKPLDEKLKSELQLSNGLEVVAIKNGPMQKAGVTKGLILMQVNDKTLNKREDFDEAVREANMSKDRVLWIRAKTKSGLNKSFTVELEEKK